MPPLFNRTFMPCVTALQELAGSIQAGAVEPGEVFGRMLEIYQAFYAAGRFGEILFEQLAGVLVEEDRAALVKTAREVADHQIEILREELIGTDG